MFWLIDLNVEEDIKDLNVVDDLAGSYGDCVDMSLVEIRKIISYNILKNL